MRILFSHDFQLTLLCGILLLINWYQYNDSVPCIGDNRSYKAMESQYTDAYFGHEIERVNPAIDTMYQNYSSYQEASITDVRCFVQTGSYGKNTTQCTSWHVWDIQLYFLFSLENTFPPVIWHGHGILPFNSTSTEALCIIRMLLRMC